MKVLSKMISEINSHQYARIDSKYWITQEEVAFSKYRLLSEMFEIINGSVQTSHYTDEVTGFPYIRISNIDYKYGINTEDVIYLDSICDVKEERILKKDDLILATIGATVGKIGMAKRCEGGTCSNNTVILRAKDKRTNTAFFEKLFQTDYFINYLFGVVSQKAQPNLQIYDLENIRIPRFSDKTVERVLCDINPNEKHIEDLRKHLQTPQKIIDRTFQNEFNFDYKKFNDLKSVHTLYSYYSAFSNNPDLRFSAKFHRDAGSFVMKQLTDISDKKIKHYLDEPIVLGASISPGDYSEDGDYQYISMATIKNWMFDSESANYVSKEYSDSKVAKTVRKNDIILARSGEGTIGKVPLIDDDNVNGVFADFTMRIRLKDYNPEFAYYYFRTSYFQYLIEIYKKGLGNNTNIFPIVIQDFPLIDISLDEQQRIVDEIHSEIAKQEDIKKQIADLRNQIDCIIEDAIAKGDE